MKNNLNTIYKNIHPQVLFFSSILCLPTVFFQDITAFIWIVALLFLILLTIKKGRIRLLPSIIILVSILFFNMLNPSGRVFITIGAFRITEGALEFGLKKAGVLLSMVFISQYSVSKDLHIKGRIGYFISMMFYFFEELTENKTHFNVKEPIKSIDTILLAVYKKDFNQKESEKHTAENQNALVWLLYVIPIIISYGLLILNINNF